MMTRRILLFTAGLAFGLGLLLSSGALLAEREGKAQPSPKKDPRLGENPPSILLDPVASELEMLEQLKEILSGGDRTRLEILRGGVTRILSRHGTFAEVEEQLHRLGYRCEVKAGTVLARFHKISSIC
jgi:hypothetical protein